MVAIPEFARRALLVLTLRVCEFLPVAVTAAI